MRLDDFNVSRIKTAIENKGDEFRGKKNMEIQSGGEKMRFNASGPARRK